MPNLLLKNVKDTNLDVTGTVTDTVDITIFGKVETVYVVDWDGEPDFVPMAWQDEEGTSKSGYRESDLTVA